MSTISREGHFWRPFIKWSGKDSPRLRLATERSAPTLRGRPPGEASGIKGCIGQIAREASLVTPIDRTLLFCPHRESPHQLQLTR